MKESMIEFSNSHFLCHSWETESLCTTLLCCVLDHAHFPLNFFIGHWQEQQRIAKRGRGTCVLPKLHPHQLSKIVKGQCCFSLFVAQICSKQTCQKIWFESIFNQLGSFEHLRQSWQTKFCEELVFEICSCFKSIFVCDHKTFHLCGSKKVTRKQLMMNAQ